MTVIKVEKLNDVFLRVYCEDMGVEAELVEFFTFEVPGAKFMPLYKAKLWDGKKRLLDPVRKTLYTGLFPYIEKFAQNNGYTVEHDIKNWVEDIPPEDVVDFANNLQLYARGNPIQLRDYQLNAISHAIINKRSVTLVPTGGGKSAIIYTFARWHLNHGRKVLVVVPTTGLVEQLFSDFQDYSTGNGWDTEKHCQVLYSGFPKQFERDILISTWQSIFRQPKAWFDQFDVIVGDESHLFKSSSLTSIMEKLTDTPYRLGTTGSLDNKKLSTLTLEGIFGPVYKVITTKQLQDEGSLAALKIKAIMLKYPDEIRKMLKKAEYQDEIDYIVTHPGRNKFIRNLAVSCQGNTLVLFQFVEKHGVVLHEMIQSMAKDRSVYLIHGDVDVDERERIRKALSTETNAIVVASVQTTATGVNIPSIENIIFASPTKSLIRVLQSIGRGLRLNQGKTHCTLFDITDDLHWKQWKNHTLKHGAERYKIYAAEQFKVKLIEAEVK